MCSPLSVFWVCVVCFLHPRMTDPRDNTCNFNGRGGYSLGNSAGAGSYKCWPEASVTGIGACQNCSSMNSGRAGGRAVAAAGTSPGPGLGIKVASGPGGALGGRHVIIQYGGGVRSSPSKSCQIPEGERGSTCLHLPVSTAEPEHLKVCSALVGLIR